MQGIGPGSILGGRYVVGHRAAQGRGVEHWSARDSTLDRPVALLVMSREHPNVDAVLDAARRVAGLDNGRLVRILDVVSESNVAYVVEEALEGSRTLSELLDGGPLPAPEVRRIAGETSVVLDVARNRGLHHQQLNPGVVVRTPDGDIKVRGLATLAALAGVDHITDEAAARSDAVAVVGLTYAGLTGHWPLPGDGGGLPPAPEVAGRVAAPADITGGVPADLDALCRLTLGNGQGPTTPGDFARQIAPWSPIPVLLPSIPQAQVRQLRSQQALAQPDDAPTGGESTVALPTVAHAVPADAEPAPDASLPDAPTAAAPEPAEVVSAEGVSAEPMSADPAHAEPERAESAKPDAPATSTSGPPLSPSGAPVRVAHRVPAPAAASTPAAGGTGAVMSPTPKTKTPKPKTNKTKTNKTKTSKAAAATTAAAAGPVAEDTAATETSVAAPTASSAPLGPSPLATLGTKTAAAVGAAGAAAAGAAKSVSGRIGGWSSETRDKARTAVEERKTQREVAALARAEQAAEAADTEDRTPTADHAGATSSDAARATTAVRARDEGALEPPVPLLPPSAAEPLTRDQSRIAIGIIVGVLVLAFGFALWGLSQIPSLPGFESEEPTLVTPTPTDGATDEDSTPDEEEAPGPSAGAALTFVSAIDFDPLGDGEERPEDLANILDGDDSTYWQTQGYQNATFSGLKPGVGVVLDLGVPSTISTITLELPLEASGSLYVTDDDAFADERPAIRSDMEPAGTFNGEGSVTVELASGTSGRYVIVWFTETSRSGEWYRARLAGASATS